MLTHDDEQAIARDLDTIDLVLAIGSPAAKQKARYQRRAIMAALKADNAERGLDQISDDELLRQLSE